MSTPTIARCARRCTAPTRRARPTSARTPSGTTAPVIERILALRREAAQLLGYPNFADAVARAEDGAAAPTRCSRSCAISRARAKPFAERDYAELAAFARDRARPRRRSSRGTSRYASEKLKTQRYAFSDRRCASTFPRTRCWRDCSASSRRSTASRSARRRRRPGIRTCASSTSATRPARWSASSTSTSTRARASRAARGWTTPSTAAASARGVQHPGRVPHVQSARRPSDGKPATFTHDEVITLFHEFGHGLHQLLTRVEVAGVSGIQGVEWDAVELPSQFMENFCWEWDVLSHMTAHVDTGAAAAARALRPHARGEELPERPRDDRASSNSASSTCCCTATYDPAAAATSPQARARRRAARSRASLPRAPYDRFMHSFAHIFAGGYAAGYYSYKWAEVLSADAFSVFEEDGRAVAGRRRAVPRRGARARRQPRRRWSRSWRFGAGAPQLDALLRHNGMTTSSA